jgi:hypothetical protein
MTTYFCLTTKMSKKDPDTNPYLTGLPDLDPLELY